MEYMTFYEHYLPSISDIITVTDVPLVSHTEGTLYGPLHSEAAMQGFERAVADVKAQVYTYHLCIFTHTCMSCIPYSRKYWRGIIFGGLAVFLSHRQY